MNFQETKNGIRGGDDSGIIKGMIATYIEQNIETANSQLPLTLVLEYGFEDVGLRIGRKLIADSKMSSLVREYAAICLVRFGTAAEIPKLLPMLTEKSVIHSWSTSQAKGKIIKTQRKPRSWVAAEGDSAYVTPRFANKVLNVGGKRGANIKTTPKKVVETLNVLKKWVDSSESDAVLTKAMEKAKRGRRKSAK